MSRPYDEITLEQVATFPRPGTAGPGHFGFTPDSRLVTFLWSEAGSLARSLWGLDPRTGERRLLAEAPPESAREGEMSREEALRRERARLRETGITAYEYARAADPAVLLVPMGGRLYARIGDGPLAELPGTEGALDPHLSRDGTRVAFVRGDELWCATVPDGDPRRLTRDATDGVTNGVAEFIAHEELGRSRGFWFSRDGRRLAFVRADSRRVPVYPIVHQGRASVEIEKHRYPFAGGANAAVELGVVSVDGGEPIFMELGPQTDLYLARVAWRPDGDLAALLLSRDQREMTWYRFDPATGDGRALFTERGEPWLNLDDGARFLETGEMLFTSEREEGIRGIFRLDEGTGEVRTVYRGEEPVVAVLDLDEARRRVAFRVAADRALSRQVLSAPLDGGAPRPLTSGPGWHDATFSPDHRRFVHTLGTLERPPRISLETTEGDEPQVIHEETAAAAAVLGLAPPRLLEVRAPDGTTLNAAIYEPPRDGRRHPVIVSVYGGPHAQRVVDDWLLTVDLRAQYLARRGYLVLKVDNRGSANRGRNFEAPLFCRMGTVEIEDQVAGVESLASRNDVDLSRVGIFGWSYGGTMTLLCLMKRPGVFHAGVAGAPVTDWDGYDTGYTERYMETPEANPEGYREASALTHAAGLAGPLLLVHGMVDENVHFRHSARLLDRFAKENRTCELLVLPEERHMPRDHAGLLYLETRIADFFDRNL